MRRHVIAVLHLVVAALAVSCAGGDGGGPSADEVEPSSESSPFTVEQVPEGFVPTVAGRGGQVASWGSDAGTDEPFTVLSPDGTADHPDVVVVSITGFKGQQGGLFQSSNAYHTHPHEQFELDGREAIYAPASDEGRYWSDLVVARAGDLAVRVTSPDATREDLVAWAARVEAPTDRSRAPAVDPPDGFELVGSVDADAVVALAPYATSDGASPGPASAHGSGWRRPEAAEAELFVLTLPGTSVDLDALPAVVATRAPGWETDVERREVDGRPAVLFGDSGSLWVQSDWGDVIVVDSRDPKALADSELIALARSVRLADRETWERFTVDARGGPGLRPDPGRTEIARGTTGGIEWLLQTGPPESWDPLDPCLKLADGTRRCTAGGSGGPDVGLQHDHEGMFFATTSVEASHVRATLWNGDVTEAPLADIPGRAERVAVLFLNPWAGHVADCPGELGSLPAGEPGAFRLDALDGEGNVLRCLRAR